VAGRLHETLVDGFWPVGVNGNEVWGSIEAKVQALIGQKLSIAVYDETNADLTGLRNVVDNYADSGQARQVDHVLGPARRHARLERLPLRRRLAGGLRRQPGNHRARPGPPPDRAAADRPRGLRPDQVHGASRRTEVVPTRDVTVWQTPSRLRTVRRVDESERSRMPTGLRRPGWRMGGLR
jgi:hypothetical protein